MNLDIPKAMIAEGHTMEAAQWAKLVVNVLPEHEVRGLVLLLANAIVEPVPRRRGDKFDPDGFATVSHELEIARAVQEHPGTQEESFTTVGEKYHKSPKTVERLYRKWIKSPT